MRMQVQKVLVAERTLLGLVAALTFVPAVLIGGVHPGTQVVVLALAAVATGLLILYRRAGEPRSLLVPGLLGIAMAVALGATLLQLLPVPEALLRTIDPQATELRALAVGSSGGHWWPISLAPWATVTEVAKQLACMAALVVAANFLHRGSRALTVARTFMIAGIALAALGLLQRALHTPRILGVYRPDWWTGFMATFVDSNHAAGFFLLVIGVGLGVAMGLSGRRRLSVLALLTLPILALLLTRSRGGMGGLLLLILAFLLLGLRERKARREALLIATGLGLVALLCFISVFDEIEARLMQALEHPIANAKVLAWRDAAAMSLDFAWTGVGRGAFVDVFTHFNQLNRSVTVTHVENLPLQAIVDWGYPVGIVVGGLVIAVVIGLARHRHLDALGRGSLAGLAALLFQNLFDFNLEFPGTAIPACILLGMVVARTVAHGRKHMRSLPAVPAQRALTALAVTCLAWALLAIPAVRYSLRAQDRRLNRLVARADRLELAVQTAESAVVHHPADYESHLLAGTLYSRFGDPRGMRHLNVAMVLNPASAAPHIAAARVLASNGRRSQAALEYRAAFERGWPMYDAELSEVLERCDSVEATLQAMPQTSDALLTLARFFERQQQPTGTRAAYGRLLQLDSSGDRGKLEAMRALIRLGDSRSVALAQDLLRLSPLPADVPTAVAALQRAGRADLADQARVSALGRFEKDWSVVSPAVDVLMKRGDLLAAAHALQTVIDAAEDRNQRIAALDKLIAVEETLGQHERAQESRYLAQQLRALDRTR